MAQQDPEAEYETETFFGPFITFEPSDSIMTRLRGNTYYELSNHLGNVLSVVTDRKLQVCASGDVLYYKAQVVSVTDYYPFGMTINERSWNASEYRFGFNGKEKDDEVKGSGNSLDFGARIYDSRLGRWLSIDPLHYHPKQINKTPYAGFWNNPIALSDPDGKCPECGDGYEMSYTETTVYRHDRSENKTTITTTSTHTITSYTRDPHHTRPTGEPIIHKKVETITTTTTVTLEAKDNPGQATDVKRTTSVTQTKSTTNYESGHRSIHGLVYHQVGKPNVENTNSNVSPSNDAVQFGNILEGAISRRGEDYNLYDTDLEEFVSDIAYSLDVGAAISKNPWAAAATLAVETANRGSRLIENNITLQEDSGETDYVYKQENNKNGNKND